MYIINKRYLLKIAFLSFLWLGSSEVGRQAIPAEDINNEYQPSFFAVIQGKSTEAILTSKMRLSVKRWTKIFDESQKKITLEDLPVPCKAKIEYRFLTYAEPIALKIEIREVWPGATTNWTLPLPE